MGSPLTADAKVCCLRAGPYHQQVVEEEDLPLVKAQLLRFVGVGHFKEPAVTHQSAVR